MLPVCTRRSIFFLPLDTSHGPYGPNSKVSGGMGPNPIDRFTYVYQFLNGRYYIYLPFDAEVAIRTAAGAIVWRRHLPRGNHELDAATLGPGQLDVGIRFETGQRRFPLHVTPD